MAVDDSLFRPRPPIRPRPLSPSEIAARGRQGYAADDEGSLDTLTEVRPEPATAPAGQAMPERSDPLPRAGDAYKASARSATRPQLTLFLVGKDYLPDGFAYANLERVRLIASEDPISGPNVVLRFTGSVVTEVVIEGRHLSSLANNLGLHVLPWLWQHPNPSDFANEHEPLIRKITLRTPEE
jgi:hypothetical protein